MKLKIDPKALALLVERLSEVAPKKELMVRVDRDEFAERLQEALDRMEGIFDSPPVIAADGVKGCAACSACAICLVDGPIPDAEPLAVAGLAGLV